MKGILASIIVTLLPGIVTAQQMEKQYITTHFCGPFAEVIQTPDTYGETLLFTSNGITFSTTAQNQPAQSGAFFFVNQATGTWTLINVYGDGMACLAQAGSEFEPYVGKNIFE